MSDEKIYELYVEADYNDGDYISEVNTITLEELERFKPLIAAIAEYGKPNENGHRRRNWNTMWHCREKDDFYSNAYAEFKELAEEFEECYCPHTEHGVHTITRIEYYEKPQRISLFSRY